MIQFRESKLLYASVYNSGSFKVFGCFTDSGFKKYSMGFYFLKNDLNNKQFVILEFVDNA